MAESQEELQEKIKKMSPEEYQKFQKENCPFCKIVKGEIPSKKVFEDKQILAILDINPISKGHLLVLPKEHYPLLPVIPEDVQKHLYKIVKELSHCCLKGLAVQGTNIFIANGPVAGQQAQHFMVHIIPREKGDGIGNFNLKPAKVSTEEMAKMKKIFSQNLPVMLKDKLKEYGLEGQKAPEITDEQVFAIILQNPQLKELIINKPEEFKAAVLKTPQLQNIFDGKNIDKLREKLIGGSEEVNLDDISGLFSDGKPVSKDESEDDDESSGASVGIEKPELKSSTEEALEFLSEKNDAANKTPDVDIPEPTEDDIDELMGVKKRRKSKKTKEEDVDLDDIADMFK